MTDINELRRLAEAAGYSGWDANQLAVTADTRTLVCCGRAHLECCGDPDVDGDEFDPICAATSEAFAAFIAAANPKAILELISENDRLRQSENETIVASFAVVSANKRLLEQRDQLRAEVEGLHAALQAIRTQVEGNIRPTVRELIIGLSMNGLGVGDPNEIYGYCDAIEAAIDAAMGKGGQGDE